MLNRFLGRCERLRATNTLERERLNNLKTKCIRRCPNCGYLVQNVQVIAPLLDHLLNTPHLSLDPLQSNEDIPLVVLLEVVHIHHLGLSVPFAGF
jgi:hypothetical protein